jgi:2-keto-4-pentenoate hydratase
MSIDLARAAAALLEARRSGRPAGPLPEGLAPRDEAEGLALQYAYAQLVGALPPAGFKIGATSRRMQEYLGLSRPAVGFMPASNLHATETTLPFAGFRGVGVECEIGVRLCADLPHGAYDRSSVAGAVGEMFAAMEIVENRYGPPPAGDLKAVGTPTLIADQVYHAGAVLGAPCPGWQSLDLAAIPGRLTVDGTERGNGTGADLLGHPLAALAWLAGSDACAVFGGLRAGQVMMLGSVTPPIWLDGPCTVQVTFDGLGTVSLRLT